LLKSLLIPTVGDGGMRFLVCRIEDCACLHKLRIFQLNVTMLHKLLLVIRFPSL